MTLRNSLHSSRGRIGGRGVAARIISAKGQTWKWLFALLPTLGSTFFPSLPVCLLQKWAHNVVCLPADRFQMLMAGSWCEDWGAGWRGGYSFLLRGTNTSRSLGLLHKTRGHGGMQLCMEMAFKNGWWTASVDCKQALKKGTVCLVSTCANFQKTANVSLCNACKHAQCSEKRKPGVPCFQTH